MLFQLQKTLNEANEQTSKEKHHLEGCDSNSYLVRSLYYDGKNQAMYGQRL